MELMTININGTEAVVRGDFYAGCAGDGALYVHLTSAGYGCAVRKATVKLPFDNDTTTFEYLRKIQRKADSIDAAGTAMALDVAASIRKIANVVLTVDSSLSRGYYAKDAILALMAVADTNNAMK